MTTPLCPAPFRAYEGALFQLATVASWWVEVPSPVRLSMNSETYAWVSWLVGVEGVEPPICRLRAGCTTTVLHTHFISYRQDPSDSGKATFESCLPPVAVGTTNVTLGDLFSDHL